jgi:hypothetical protein
MTPFEKWCDENGYDPKGEFVYIGANIPKIDLRHGDVLRLEADDRSAYCLFRQVRESATLYPTVCPSLSSLTQHKPTPFDPETFDFRQVLPKCWVRDREIDEWREAWFIGTYEQSTFWFVVVFDTLDVSSFRLCTLKDPTTEQHKTELKARAEELRAELARIEKELGE